MPLQK
jgi:hypothetical protein